MTQSAKAQQEHKPKYAAYRAVFPHILVRRRWVTLLWAIPAAIVVLAVVVLAAILLRQLPAVQSFIAEFPGSRPRPEAQGFPWWLRWQHFLNIVFLIPIVRAGLQILAGRPRLYWSRHSKPGAEWLRIQRRVEDIPRWSMREDPVSLPSAVGLPGVRRSTGIARMWHLALDLLWLLNGLVFFVLLFATGQWVRITPTNWAVFPDALSTLIQYASLDFPVNNSWVTYNGLQLLTYFVTVFVAAPLAIITGLLQSPQISRRLHLAQTKWANLEVARSVHAIVLGWFILFTIIHVTLVFATGALQNLAHITLGRDDSGVEGLFLFAIGALVLAAIWALLSPVTSKFPQWVQKASATVLGPLARWF